MPSITVIHQFSMLLVEIAGLLTISTTIIKNIRQLIQALLNLWKFLHNCYKAIIRWFRSWRRRR